MGRLIYSMMQSLDGYVADAAGTFGWAEPDESVHTFANQLWRASDKVIYSTTLDSVGAARTRIERAFEPDAIRLMKHELVDDISISGPTLAAQAIAADLVDEYQLFIVPVIVGGGARCMIYTHVLNKGGRGVRSPLDGGSRRRDQSCATRRLCRPDN